MQARTVRRASVGGQEGIQPSLIVAQRRTSRTTPTAAVPAATTIRTTVATSKMSHDDPGSPAGLALKNAGASVAMAPHQTAVAMTMVTIARATAAASIASAVSTALESSIRRARRNRQHGPQRQGDHDKGCPRQKQNTAPVDATVGLMRWEVVGPYDKGHCHGDGHDRRGESSQKVPAHGDATSSATENARKQVRREALRRAQEHWPLQPSLEAR